MSFSEYMGRVKTHPFLIASHIDVLCMDDVSRMTYLQNLVLHLWKSGQHPSYPVYTSFSDDPIGEETPAPFGIRSHFQLEGVCVGGCMLNIGKGMVAPVLLIANGDLLHAEVPHAPSTFFYKQVEQASSEPSEMERLVHGPSLSDVLDARSKVKDIDPSERMGCFERNVVRHLAPIAPYLAHPIGDAQRAELEYAIKASKYDRAPRDRPLTPGYVVFNTTLAHTSQTSRTSQTDPCNLDEAKVVNLHGMHLLMEAMLQQDLPPLNPPHYESTSVVKWPAMKALLTDALPTYTKRLVTHFGNTNLVDFEKGLNRDIGRHLVLVHDTSTGAFRYAIEYGMEPHRRELGLDDLARHLKCTMYRPPCYIICVQSNGCILSVEEHANAHNKRPRDDPTQTPPDRCHVKQETGGMDAATKPTSSNASLAQRLRMSR